eukprot:1865157-Pyramimonas_sp.AAC.1
MFSSVRAEVLPGGQPRGGCGASATRPGQRPARQSKPPSWASKRVVDDDDDEVDDEREHEGDAGDAPVGPEELVVEERGLEDAAECPADCTMPDPPAHSERSGEEQRDHTGDSGEASGGAAAG